MEIDGSITKNLASALRSARRLRGHPIHADTLGHWTDLLTHAPKDAADGSTEPIKALIVELENELANRPI